MGLAYKWKDTVLGGIVNKSKNSYFPKLCLEYLNYPGTYVDEDIKRYTIIFCNCILYYYCNAIFTNNNWLCNYKEFN